MKPSCTCPTHAGYRCGRYAIVIDAQGNGYCAQHARLHGVFAYPGWERVDGMGRDRRTVAA